MNTYSIIYNITLSSSYIDGIAYILKNNSQVSHIILPNNRSKNIIKNKFQTENIIFPELITISEILEIPDITCSIMEFFSQRTKNIPFNTLYELSKTLYKLIKTLITNNIDIKQLQNLEIETKNWEHTYVILSELFNKDYIIKTQKMFHVKLRHWLQILSNTCFMTIDIGAANFYSELIFKMACKQGIPIVSGLEIKNSYNYCRNLKLFSKIQLQIDEITNNIEQNHNITLLKCDAYPFDLKKDNNFEFQNLNHIKSDTFHKLFEFDTQENEAKAIALMIRSNLYDGKKVLVVCPREELSTYIQKELLRWNIIPDISSGTPFRKTFFGQIIHIISNMILNNFSNQDVINFIKASNNYKKYALNLELFLRTQQYYPSNFFQMLETFIEQKTIYIKSKNELDIKTYSLVLNEDFYEILCKLKKLSEKLLKSYTLNEWFNYVIELSQLIDAECTVSFVEITKNFTTDISLNLSSNEFCVFLRNQILSQPIRSQQHTDNITIIGPIEAQLIEGDLIIICGANEQSWQPLSTSDFWMSQNMIRQLKLETSDDLFEFYSCILEKLLYHKKVYITRSKTLNNETTRIHPIFEKMVHECNSIFHQILYTKQDRLIISDSLDPIPPLSVRPTILWASELEQLKANPYVFYAKNILKLKELPKIDQRSNILIIGNLMHEALDQLFKKFKKFTYNLLELELLNTTNKHWINKEKLGLWFFCRKSLIKKIIDKINDNINPNLIFFTEIKGNYNLSIKNNEEIVTVTISCKADRLDIDPTNNSISIIDYKTGTAPKLKEVKNGTKIQLSAEALIAQHNGFNIGYNTVKKMAFWQLKEKQFEIIDISKSEKESIELCNDVENDIKDIIQKYNIDGDPYVFNIDDNTSYNKAYFHLARRKEQNI